MIILAKGPPILQLFLITTDLIIFDYKVFVVALVTIHDW